MAGVAVLITITVYIAVAWGSGRPAFAMDEINMLGNSRVIAGETPVWELSGLGFMPGLAILLAPVWWFTSSATVVYVTGLILTSVLAVLTIWPLSHIVRWVGVSPTVSVVVASVIMVAPARSFYANFMLSESLLLLCLCILLLVARRASSSWTLTQAILLGLSVGLIVLSHGRAVAIAVAVGIWCLAQIRRDRIWLPILSAGTGVVASLGALWLYLICSKALYGDEARLDRLGEGPVRTLSDLVATGAGQLWYLTLAWPLVGVVGAAVVARRVRTDPVMLLLGLATVLTFVLSVQQIKTSDSPVRLDTWFYGRYNDPLWTVLAALGLAVLVRMRWPLVNVVAVVATAVVGGLMYWTNVPRIPENMFWQAVHVPGVAPWLNTGDYATSGAQNWPWLSVMPTALTALLALLALIRFWLIPVLAALWITTGLLHDSGTQDEIAGPRPVHSDPWGVDKFPESARLGVEPELAMVINNIAYHASDQPVRRLEAQHAVGEVDVLWTRANASIPSADGAKVLANSASRFALVWVYPGPLQDQMDAEGLLTEAQPLFQDSDSPDGN